ncbi:hypothetical protein Vretimale_5068 [Volvox reticuliferus]|uniref:Uncharacterized protein n=1 Tax=Volvox reticuliferus TaxID=1737510 RepID=A0A8J4C3R0_9CHLO|nr:hypothetical protein Vretifemale_4076 [Volvox reticuliferus]GIM00001.1 hypothetical protein Vretimale_5068 [Volvox reticuliferus]
MDRGLYSINMSRRPGAADSTDSQHTFGHNLLTEESIKLLADQASHWAVILKFENNEEVPQHILFPKDGLINVFAQGRICRHTLLAGFRTTRAPKRPVPACFFRTLDFLLQYVAAGNTYRAINDKEEAKGFPPAAWCRPPVVSAREDAEAMTAAATAGATPEALEHTPPTDPIRLFYACHSWCCIYQYQMSAISVRQTIGVSPAEMYHLYTEGMLSEYLPMMGLAEDAPQTIGYVPASAMLPLGALLYMHEHGRPYLPMTLNELREVRSYGLMSLAVRANARPMKLPAGLQAGVSPAAAAAAAAAVAAGNGGGAVSGSSGSRNVTRMESSISISGGGTSGRQGNGSGGGTARNAAAGGADSSGGNARSPSPEPDPILDDPSRWIMPQPFDVPTPAPASAATTAPSAAANGDTAAAATATATANHVASDGGNAAPTVPAAVGPAAMLPSSHFLQFNAGVQPFFETPPLRLFLGDRGQAGLTSNWWYVDSGTKEIKGPYSPETMLLSSITPCREMHDETLVCGTDADVRPPVLPPLTAFVPLGKLLHDISDGTYVLVTRAEIVSPLARSPLGNRIREPKPESPPPPPPPQQQQQPAALAPVSAPVVAMAAPVAVPVTRAAPNVTVASAMPVSLVVQAVAAPVRTSSLPSQPPFSLQPQPQAAPVLQPPQLQPQAAPVLQPPQLQPQAAPVLQPPQLQPQAAPVLQPPQLQPQATPVLQPPQLQPQATPVLQPPQLQPQATPVLQPPQLQPQATPVLQPPQPQHVLQQQQPQPVQHAAPIYPAPTAAAVHGPVRGLPLPLSQLLAARSRPVPVAAAAVPAYTLPGGAVYMPQYSQHAQYSGQTVFAQPVLGNVPLQRPAPAPALAPQQQPHH